ncbi:2-amino-4-hydroxy-6-hydroxymethyldihydropteridine diphosphokinase [Moraxella oblonga]|uniref:2-amino-4-hydroxy-6- hydroxymethyldihydropteridine diphosphokinase n=1 Tax=Moraxella oblonga TaxID=200413 RepID=UPI000832A3A2|nr:2-amino-4-hydroxy-6-hydroxymethyldihydropteridine diphosphokinase [Moraxella oblonga]
MNTHYIIALGSNVNSDTAFQIAIDELQKLGGVILSSVVTGGDFTGKTDLVYRNVVALITLSTPCDYDVFNEILKNIEKQCGRNNDNTQVPMDLDILAFYQVDKWCVVKKRYPFKMHEKKGLNEVAPFLLD